MWIYRITRWWLLDIKKCPPSHSLLRDFWFHQKIIISGNWRRVEYRGTLDYCGILAVDNLIICWFFPSFTIFFWYIKTNMLVEGVGACSCIQMSIGDCSFLDVFFFIKYLIVLSTNNKFTILTACKWTVQQY